MKKILWLFTGLVVVVAAAVILGPGFVDWNSYKSDISAEVFKATGRTLAIDGDIQVTVIPKPTMIVGGVSLSNAEGAASEKMVSVERAEVEIALAPLLTGRVKIETVRLLAPVIELEQFKNGGNNWSFQPETGLAPSSGAANEDQASAGDTPAGGNQTAGAIAVDRFTIENGEVTYRDGKTGLVERIEDINADISAVSLLGPMESKGSLKIKGFPVTYQINISEIIQDRTVQFNLNVGVEEGDGKLSLNGALVGLDSNPEFQGQVALSAKRPSDALKALTGNGLPAVINQPFATSAEVTARKDAVNVSQLSVMLGADKITGTLAVVPGDILDIKARLSATKLDLDPWAKAEKTPVKKPEKNTVTLDNENNAAAKPKPAAKGFSLPDNINASLEFSADAASYNGGLVRNIIVNSELSQGAVTISQLSAEFPGGSDAALFGFLTTENNDLAFEGELESNIGDLRRVLSWLDMDMKSVPKDRLRKISLKTGIKLKQNQLQIENLDLGFDGSKLTGAVTVALRKRLSFGANLTLDKINLEAYLPQSGAVAVTKKSSSGSGATGTKTKPSAAAPKAASLLPAFLSEFDANIKARIGSVVYQGERIKKINVDGTLFNGNLDLRNFSVDNLAGATVKTSGKIKSLAKTPVMEGVRLVMKARNTAKLFKILKRKPPIPAKRIGAVAVNVRLDGGLLKPGVKGSIAAAGATIDMNGAMDVLDVAKMIDATIRLRHKKPVRLLKNLGSTYRPKGPVGALDMKTKVQGGTQALTFNNLVLQLGKFNIVGDAKVDLSASRPKIFANLTSNGIVLDAFMPATKKAGLGTGEWKIRPASWIVPGSMPAYNSFLRRIAVNLSPRWSNDAIDLSAMNSVDADIQLKSPLLTYGKYLVEKADVALLLNAGILNVKKVTANMFGGQLAAVGTINSTGNIFDMAATMTGANVAAITKTLTGTRAADGMAAFKANLRGQANSVAAMVTSLNGDGNFSVKGVDVRSAAKGSPLAGLFDLILSLNQFGATLGGKAGKADASASFRMVNGVARSDDFILTSSVANGAATAVVDLPAWKIDASGKVKVSQGLLTTLLASKVTGVLDEIPFSIKGAIDEPDVNIKTGNIGKGIGGAAGGLIKKAPKPLQGLLQGILGGGQQPQQQQTAPAPGGTSNEPTPQPQQQQQQQQQNPNPLDIFKNLLKQ